jgi:hypothetical protein
MPLIVRDSCGGGFLLLADTSRNGNPFLMHRALKESLKDSDDA